MITSTKKYLSPTIYYLLTGFAFAVPVLAFSGSLSSDWALGDGSAPGSLAVIHCLVLGFLLTVAFGVLYQIVPIAFQAPPLPRQLWHWHLPLHVLSVVLMICGFIGQDWFLVGLGGIALLCGAVLFAVFLLRSYTRARNRTIVHRLLGAPLLSFLVTVLFGLWQAFDSANTTSSTIGNHVVLGGFAFWVGLVMVLSYKLVPMFALSHGYRASLPRAALFYYAGVVTFLVTAWVPLPASDGIVVGLHALAALLSGCGLILFSWDVTKIVRARKRKRPVRPVITALISTAVLVASHLALLVCIFASCQQAFIPIAYVLVFGGLVPLVLSYVQKIVPFLWFEYRFSKRPERKTAPLIDDMVHASTARVAMSVYFLGMAATWLCIILMTAMGPSYALSTISQVTSLGMAFGSGILGVALVRVLLIGGRRPDDDAPASS